MVPAVVLGVNETEKIIEALESYYTKDGGCLRFVNILKEAINKKEYGINILCRLSDEAIKETVDKLKGVKNNGTK